MVDSTSAWPTGEGSAAHHESGDVRDVRHENRADLVGDRGEGREVDRARYGRAAAEDDAGALPDGDVAHLVHVDATGVPADAVGDAGEPPPGGGDRPAVGEVAAHREGHAEDLVTGREEGEVDGKVGR